MLWALDETLTVPSYENILKMPSEHKGAETGVSSPTSEDAKRFPILLPTTKPIRRLPPIDVSGWRQINPLSTQQIYTNEN